MFDALEDVAGYRRPIDCRFHRESSQCGEKDNVWRSHADSTLVRASPQRKLGDFKRDGARSVWSSY